MEDQSKKRSLKSFVLRQGRRTKAQQYALDHFWAVYGIENTVGVLDFQPIFGNSNPVTLEIGFGNGESLAAMALAEPARNFLGIEVHSPGVGHLLHLINEHQLQNIRVMNGDAVAILQQQIAAHSLDRLQLYFPDPWHKKRHNKRRIVQPEFVQLVASLLAPGGIFHMATDWEDYAVHMAAVMQASTAFCNCAPDPAASPYSPRPDFRPLTKFENRGVKLGHGVWDLLYYQCKKG